ncbi:MAG: alpha/beta hydrolase [Pirellulales bacterium]
MLGRHARRALGSLAVFLGVQFVASIAAADEAFEVIPDQVYIERDSGPLKADLYVPHGDGPFPAMIVVHGGAWASGTKAQLAGIAKGLAKLGFTTAAISYRLAPQQTFPAQIYDCQAAVRWLRTNAEKYKVDPDRIGGYGYSAGGHLVALLGALDDDDEVHETGLAADAPSARLQVVVAGGAPCDFRVLPADSQRLAYWIGGTPAEKPDAYKQASPTNFVTSDDPPMYFFHGGADNLVPPRSPLRMVERLKEVGVPVEFYEVPGAGHMGAVVDPTALQHAMAFANRYLKGAVNGK